MIKSFCPKNSVRARPCEGGIPLLCLKPRGLSSCINHATHKNSSMSLLAKHHRDRGVVQL